MNYLDGLYKETSVSKTQNGAKAYNRTGSALLDFFALAGAKRDDKEGALNLFIKAYSEDKLSEIRILFYFRDVRQGQGERDLFRICLQWIGSNEVEVFESIIKHIPEYGRWDDMFFDNNIAVEFIRKQLALDYIAEKPTLLAKWLPSITASSDNTKRKAKYFANKWGIDDVTYRKTLSIIRKRLNTPESLMSSNKWEDIDYSTVPSQASRIYSSAFGKHDHERYNEFLDSVEKGESKINAGTLYPYQIYNDVMNHGSRNQTSNVLWEALPDYTQGKNALVVADVSGSMFGDPISVSVSLALYFAERNKGYFKDYFMTFSSKPTLQKVVGATLVDKMRSIGRADWEMGTDITKTIEVLVDTAVKNNVPVEEMPETIYIISDMEFDECAISQSINQGRRSEFQLDATAHEMAKDRYTKAGYKVPNIVFWNVKSSGNNLPTQQNEYGVSLVSGFSPSIFKLAVEGKTPIETMNELINSERYLAIEL